MTGKLIDIVLGMNGRQRITVELNHDFSGEFTRLKDAIIDIDIKKHRWRRSLSANAYFHVLVNKIAAEIGYSEEQVKKRLVTEYGALARDADGCTVGFKVPSSVDAAAYYPYIKCFDTRTENGKEFKCYLVYKQTRDLDSKEMAHLIDGAISEARELGIETDTPEQLARYKEDWKKQ